MCCIIKVSEEQKVNKKYCLKVSTERVWSHRESGT